MKKTILAIIFILVTITPGVKPAFAQTGSASLETAPCPASPDPLSACRIAFILETNVKTLGEMILGKPGDPQSVQNSAVGFMASAIGLTIQVPPVSGKDYLSYMGSRFRLPGTPTPVYAQTGGVGYTSLYPVLQIWTAMRNLAYLVFAVVFVVIGLMIIFRVKIDPKTAASIQSALPKIIFALILVTFSYAIAGFLVDLMYVAIALIMTITRMMGIGTVADEVGEGVLSNQTVMHFFLQGSMWYTISSISAAVGQVFDSLLGMGFLGNITSFIASGLALLIVAIALLWALAQTWFKLIGAYANIILGIIFSPLQLMLDAIPGQNQFEAWLRTMLANILAFPTVIVMIFIGMALATNLGQGIQPNQPYSGFVPPLIGGNSQVAIQALIGMGIILTIPKTLEILQEALKVPPFKYGTAWGEAIGAGWAGTQQAYGISAPVRRPVTRFLKTRVYQPLKDVWNQFT